MVKASLGINILAVLPLASNASSAVLAEMIVPAIMARLQANIFASFPPRTYRPLLWCS
jgi:hypothetical protein